MDADTIDRFEELIAAGIEGSCQRIPGGFTLVTRIKDPFLAPFVPTFNKLMVAVYEAREVMTQSPDNPHW